MLRYYIKSESTRNWVKLALFRGEKSVSPILNYILLITQKSIKPYKTVTNLIKSCSDGKSTRIFWLMIDFIDHFSSRSVLASSVNMNPWICELHDLFEGSIFRYIWRLQWIIGPSGVRALPLASGINVVGQYKWHFFLFFFFLSSSSGSLLILPEGVVVGIQIFAWAPS